MGRLILVIIFFLLSLLCILPAPAYLLWYVSIMVSEFPWIFLMITIGLLLWGFKITKYRIAGNVLAFATLLLFTSPVIRAYTVSKDINKRFKTAFGTNVAPTAPGEPGKVFHFWNMVAGINARQIAYNTYVYSTVNGNHITLDYYPSQSAGPRPCVIVVHGGSWAAGDSHQLPELNSHLALAGYNVAAINYRLAPVYKHPAPNEDLKTALDYIRKHANALHADTTRFVLLGRSAGAQIVLLSAYTLHDVSIKGVISFYGPADMVWGYFHPANPLVLNTCKVMEDYLGGTYNAVPQNYVSSSPVEAVTMQAVPTLLIQGLNDPLVSYQHSVHLNKKLEEYKVPHMLLTLPWATHGCDYTLNGPSGQLSTYTIDLFLKQVCR